MEAQSSSGNYCRGLAPLVILASLQREDMYGYQLVQELEQQSGGAVLMQEGSLYPVLYRLLDAGYISDQKVQVGRRMTRVYYHIEPAGAKHLQRLIVEYKAMTDGVLRIIVGGGDSERA